MTPTDETDSKHQRYHGLRKRFLVVSMAGVALAWARLRPFRAVVEGESMMPTLGPGEFLVGIKNGTIRVGSLVVMEHPDRPGYEMVKRVAAGPGDRVGARVLGANEYWVLGDNPAESTDSRSFGPVGRRSLKGVVRARYWPASRLAWLV